MNNFEFIYGDCKFKDIVNKRILVAGIQLSILIKLSKTVIDLIDP